LRRAALLVAALVVGGCAWLTNEKQGELIFRPTRQAWWGFDAASHRYAERWIATD
jgi:hypothetical protein